MQSPRQLSAPTHGTLLATALMRGAGFVKRYPRSLFGPAVEEALKRAADTESPGLLQ